MHLASYGGAKKWPPITVPTRRSLNDVSQGLTIRTVVNRSVLPLREDIAYRVVHIVCPQKGSSRETGQRSLVNMPMIT